MRRKRLTGADPVIGEDGLPTAPEPFWPAGWFRWVIVLAVLGCLLGGAAVLLGLVQ